jgi:type VII secretion-associated serine protease mycosin
MLRSRDRRLNWPREGRGLPGRRLPGRRLAGGRPTGRGRLSGRWRGTALALVAAVPIGLGAAALAPAVAARADAVRSTQTWVLDDLHLVPAWNVTRGQGVVVAVIDSGVSPTVDDLAGSVITGPNFSGVNTSPLDPNWGVHGTWMASLIAGHGHGFDDDSGIIGAAPGARVLSIRVITDAKDPNHRAYEHEPAAKGQRELAEAIRYAVSHDAKVISMSLGYGEASSPVRAALQDAYEHNVVVVASAGNSGDAAGADGTAPAPYSYPADYPGVLSVGAVNSSNQVASFSSENQSVQVAAPGYKVPAQGNDGTYWYVSGTSPACALTAGVVALIKAKYPRLTDPQVISAITSSTDPSTRPPGGYDQQIGFGVVDAVAALTAAHKLSKAAPPPPGLASAAHFGGGVSAIPAPPVAPRRPVTLILYCLLGAVCLAVVALATSRLLGQRETATAGSSPGGGGRASHASNLPPRAAGMDGPPPPARHAAPRGRGHQDTGAP